MPPSTPKGIYVVAVVFFFAALISLLLIVATILGAFGVDPGNLRTIYWVLAAYFLALLVVLFGTYKLVRLHPVPQLLMFVITAVATVALMIPPQDSPFASLSSVYLSRVLLDLPLLASCVYLCRPRFRAARPRLERLRSRN
ncbi:MAG TPA: hypothetical protein VGY57_06905 [Vicinamibacterales bacterium]|jgi:hypothetical protein|nr:hypothetical protein [Vicinamibacterales bacterium]